MKKTAFFVNLAFILLICVGDLLYILKSYSNIFPAFNGLWLKGPTSVLFVLMGAVNLYFALHNKIFNLKFCILLLCGLFFAMLGDILLNIHFITGAILFAIGHLFFFASYCFVSKLNWKDLICGIAIFIPSLLLIVLGKFFDYGGVLMEIVCVIYALVISFMVGKALSNLISENNLQNLITFLGSALFFISDLMLLLGKFANLPIVVDILCLVTYYPAEILLALSILLNCSLFTKTNNASKEL